MKIEYDYPLKDGTKVTFIFNDGSTILTEVGVSVDRYFLYTDSMEYDQEEMVELLSKKLQKDLEIERNKIEVIDECGIFPYTSSLENLLKFIDSLCE